MKIKINPLFFVTLAICAFFGDFFHFFSAYISLILHELVHLFFLCRENAVAECITLEPFGIAIKTKACGWLSPKVYLSAPLFNVFLALVFYYLYKETGNKLFLEFGASNSAIGFFNLIPVLPFDGGRAIMCGLKRKNIFVLFSGISGFLILLSGILFVKSLNFNFSLIIIGIFVIANSFSEKEQLFATAVAVSKNRLTREITEKIPTKILTVPHTYSIHKLISELDSKYFYMINIIKDRTVIATISEATLTSGAINGKRILDDFV